MEFKDAFSAVRCYIERGCAVIPIPPRSKAPTRSNWPKFRPDLETMEKDFQADGNVGLLLGEPSGGLVDIDLDCSQAIDLAADWLPQTGWVHGRHTKARSHFWYRCEEGLRPAKYSDVDGSCLLELRSTGQQTLVPPSVHPSGERVYWYAFQEPAPVTAETLVMAVSRLAACTLLARHWPTEGSRQDFALALSGSLLRGGLSMGQAEKLIKFAAEAAGDEEAEKRTTVVNSTEMRLADCEPVQGLPTLREMLGEDVVKKLAQWLKLRTRVASSTGETSKSNAATRLLTLVDQAELFASEDGKPFATLRVDGHSETYPIMSSAFSWYLQKALYEKEGKAVSNSTLTDAVSVLAARAQFSGVRRATYIRVGGDNDVIYLDLGTDRWNAVRIDSAGWSIVQDMPVAFWRSQGMHALPEPKRHGQLEIFRQVLNIDDDADWHLILAWLVAAFRPTGPYPILVLIGQAGSAKSTTAQLLRKTIDPALPILRSLPRDERDLMIGANSNWILAFDNLSGISTTACDILCRISTGGGYAKRALYSNDEEMLFYTQRPIVLTSIDDIATREDLLDRAIVLSLPPIPDNLRLDERTLWKNFSSMQPYVLGNLLDALSEALRNHQSVHLSSHPRLADFTRWVTAAESSLGLSNGAMIDALTENRAAAFEAGIDADVVASAIITFMEHREKWCGIATELLDALTEDTPDRTTRQRAWPKNPSQLGNRLRRVVNILEQKGLIISFDRAGDHSRSRMISILNAHPTVRSVRRVHPNRKTEVRPAAVDSADGQDTKTPSLWRRLMRWNSQKQRGSVQKIKRDTPPNTRHDTQ